MTQLSQTNDYSRKELRFVGIKAKASDHPLSHVLNVALTQAQIGLLDAEALYAHVDRMGLSPYWAADSTDFWVQDPLAGALLVCCELTTSTIH
ncbi:hypothetical protein ALO95_200310 [Pseudomonas syringae pv. antirrhini]|uniref:Uncharacterized protein n=1 Tax=Pseudomonas amygdali pv. ulmi TaxID=251720 RepID=A0A0Q0ENF2_PSEA0|nr:MULTISPECIES: hypothetical protein [Pseudomonas syringae group]KPZ12440.1 hypothetical protein ALO41_200114 [Pseudomonas amygdali pv. ulmi]KWS16860.1 hypothetical protein AL065_26670 [Pseudomonas amygdali pv. ulmi]PAB26058.1 hypothetical protein CCZ00_24640 [Pseudomonas savastanoi pv. fraxini]RMP45671.1 hypothetical protein ALQ23_200234 [Pseudomonas syringae pv. antirrhini]RMW21509.1 hypothetical protein ALO95_200310 [Pseudomonas syringae pv. antirrhini]